MDLPKVLPESIPWRSLTDPVAKLGEVPIYDDRLDSLFWIDVFGRKLHRTGWRTGETRTWRMPLAIGSYALHDDPGHVVVALQDGIHAFDLDTSALTLLSAAPFDTARQRFNDGRCDPQGRFWVGTMRLPHAGLPNGSGHFYRQTDSELSAEIDGVTVANGIAFSPGGDTMYLADRVNARLLAYDFDGDAGTVSGERVFASVDANLVPDGAAVDDEGGYWIAMFGAGEIHRYTPDGVLDRILQAPVSTTTMCAFAGPDLGTMVVTTGRFSLSEDQLGRQPLAGAVLVAEVGATGIPEPRAQLDLRIAGPSQSSGAPRGSFRGPVEGG